MSDVRSIWNGAISFGLVSIPIKLMNATENHSISFRQIHTEDGGRIRYRKVCETEDREVPSSEIGKAYEDADGTMIPITDEDLASLPIPTTRTIEIVAFVPADRIDPLQMDTAYYLSANGAPAAKPYTLLREALKRSQKVAVAKFALRGRERLGMLRVVDDVIAMHGLLWPDEIRAPENVAPDEGVTVRDKELDLADALMDTLGEVDLAELHDDYREAVEELIAAKASGEAVPSAPAAEASGGKVIDLMSALENSVRQARGAQGARREDAEVKPLRKRAAKKTAAGSAKPASTKKKAPAKKAASAKSATSAKKATSKSAAGEKSSDASPPKKAPARKKAPA
ncbi:Ku protein [Streptomyces sp. NPDC060205]|uniref:non-homologous end joining protein Ku n=1 Tax=Streptomyces sp. NPDC060205 TaxID=3347072 RepID=UPI003654D996